MYPLTEVPKGNISKYLHKLMIGIYDNQNWSVLRIILPESRHSYFSMHQWKYSGVNAHNSVFMIKCQILQSLQIFVES